MKMAIIEVNDNNFEQEITEYSGVALVDFAAEWCGPCQRMKPSIEELGTEYAGKAKVAHVDIDKSRSIAAKYGIMSIPCVIVFKNGKEVERSIGLVPKATLAGLIGTALED